MRKLILKSFLSPGDIVMMTAAVRDLHRCHPRRFQTDVRTSCLSLWENNPYLTPLKEKDPGVEVIHCAYPLINTCNSEAFHCIHGYIQFLNERLGLTIRPTRFSGDIHLSDLEKSWYSQVYELTHRNIPFWIVAAGGKYDVTIKWWETTRYQKVVDHFRGKIQFVQVGDYGHHHPRLRGVIDLRGKTNLRELVRLVYHAQGVLCGITSLMHLAAAVEFKENPTRNRPCVVIAGAREPAYWEAYPDHQYIQSNGALACCSGGGCWKDRTVPLGDGDPRDQKEHLCVDVVDRLPHCMWMITPEEVIRRIEMYFNGGVVKYLDAAEFKAGQRAVQATRKNNYDDQPLNFHTAPAACARFIEQIPRYEKNGARPSPDRGNRRQGNAKDSRGIVICGGGLRYFPGVWVCVNMLRHLGCKLPIEVWYLGPNEMDRQMIKLLEPFEVECVDAARMRKKIPSRILAGWELKAYAILHSKFREVLLLDADNVPVVNPEFLFETKPYRKTGAIFWPDLGRFKKTHAIWDNCALQRPEGPEFESGQIVVDRERCWTALCLAMWFNENSDFYYEHLHGDKETFHLAFRKIGQPFAMPSRPIEKLPGTMCQHDFDGRRIFQHRNTDKWNLFISNPVIEGFRYEAECRAFLRQLQELWDGGTGHYVMGVGKRLKHSVPRLVACMISCEARKELREQTLRSLRSSDWGNRPIHVELDKGGSKNLQENQTRTAKAALRRLLSGTDADYIIFLEDDLAVNRFFLENLLHWPPLLEGRVTLAGLYNPGLGALACDVKRQAWIIDAESIYGSQAFLLERKTAAYVIKHWDEVEGMQDIRISRLAGRLKQPIFYHCPSLIQHVGKASTWGGRFHRAWDYSSTWRNGRTVRG